ncbi:MAG TPA: phosphate/phosphite/phosphonate ABC transporter substrate-binding protein [Flavisolibacter sp.]
MKPTFFLLIVLFFTKASMAQPLRMAVYQYADNSRTQNLQPLALHLEKRLAIPVTVRSYPTVHALIKGMQNKEVDVAFISTFGYLLLQAGNANHPMVPVTALVAPNPDNNYRTAIVSRRDAALSYLEDLHTQGTAKRMVFVATGSTSGNLVPRLMMNGVGIRDADTHFSSVTYSGTHAQALQTLLSGSADVAAMGSTEWEKLDTVQKKDLKLLELSAEIPLGPVLLTNELAPRIRDQVTAELLSLHQSNAPALEAIKAAWSEARQATHFVAITEDYYRPFLSRLGTTEAVEAILKKFIQ